MKNLIHKTLISEAGFAGLVLRVPIGLILAAHGSQKLFAWFGGYGLEGTGQWMDSIGLSPGFIMALLAGSAEFFGGIALDARLIDTNSRCDNRSNYVGRAGFRAFG